MHETLIPSVLRSLRSREILPADQASEYLRKCFMAFQFGFYGDEADDGSTSLRSEAVPDEDSPTDNIQPVKEHHLKELVRPDFPEVVFHLSSLALRRSPKRKNFP